MTSKLVITLSSEVISVAELLELVNELKLNDIKGCDEINVTVSFPE